MSDDVLSTSQISIERHEAILRGIHDMIDKAFAQETNMFLKAIKKADNDILVNQYLGKIDLLRMLNITVTSFFFDQEWK